MTRILIVDDDQTLLHFLEEFLVKQGYGVVSANRGQKALKLFYSERPDLVVLDVMMPGMDGWEVCARIRELADVPILMLTAKTEESDKLRGFRLGVYDYVTKPFSLAELGARVRAILSRSQAWEEARTKTYRTGQLQVDLRKREALLKDDTLDLTPTEFRLLAALVSRLGEAVSREQLIEQVWGEDRQGGGSTLRRYVWLLRQKIEEDPSEPRLLVTVRGYGYRLENL
jgi:two-component system KDP operon response regulator KdpE